MIWAGIAVFGALVGAGIGYMFWKELYDGRW